MRETILVDSDDEKNIQLLLYKVNPENMYLKGELEDMLSSHRWDPNTTMILLEDGVPTEILGSDTCEPEDATFFRHFNWVVTLVDRLLKENNELLDYKFRYESVSK